MNIIICPNCDKEMKNNSYMYYGLADWDMDYPATEHEEYYCKQCKIKYINGDWNIPKIIEVPTQKQIKCVNVINNVLGTDFIPLIKNKTTKFIKENIEKSKDINRNKNDYTELDGIFYINDV